jgi:alpha-glucosidase
MSSDSASPEHWYDTAVVYEIYPRSFQDSDGDGVGDLPGIISRLDYLNDGTPESLGVDAIWLTPIYPSPLFDFGYDIADYEAIDPLYGTLDDFERLTAEARRRGIRIVMDLVANHTSHLHPWFQASKSSRGSAKRDWYVWRDPAPDGGPPNNWISVFGGPAWTSDEATGQYYLHSFLAEQPDLNWRNPEVREAIFDVVRFWMARGVDGFRLDAIAHIAKDELLRDNPPSSETLSTVPLRSTGYESQIHLYNQNQPVIHEWLSALRAVVDEDGKPRLLVSEIYGLDPEDVARYHGAFGPPEMNMSFNFGVLQSQWRADEVRAAVDAFESRLPSGIWPNIVLNNHDQSRFVSRHDADGRGEERARVAAILLLTLRGAAFLYYGEEIGMRDGEVPREMLQDPVGVRFWPDNPGRDPARTPMQWQPGPGAGFTDGSPWLPIGPETGSINVASEHADPDSMLSLYRRLIWLRKSSAALRAGTYRPIDGTPPGTFCYLRDTGSERILVALNFGDEKRFVSIPELGPLRLLIGTHADRSGREDAVAIHLRPHEGLVLQVGA